MIGFKFENYIFLIRFLYYLFLFIFLTYANYYFLEYRAHKVPDEYKIFTNLIIFPFFFGVAERIFVNGKFFYLIAYVIFIQLTTLFAMDFEGDPAKIGLGGTLILSIIIFNVLGFSASYWLVVGIGKLLDRHL